MSSISKKYCVILLVHISVTISARASVYSTNLQDNTQRWIKGTQNKEINRKNHSSDSLNLQKTQPKDTIPTPIVPIDSLSLDQKSVDQTHTPLSSNRLEDALHYQAQDSIIVHFDQQLSLYKQADISYQDTKLEAAEIDVLFSKREIEARPLIDSTGRIKEHPTLKEQNQTYLTDYIRYNFNTRRALIKGVVTQEGEAYIHGEQVKLATDRSTYVNKARYTTCNYKQPHFHFRAERIKSIPGGKTLTAPFHLRVGSTPLPLGFPFGFFARPEQKSSGILVPRYGEERARGFFLRNLGYYFSINPYMDLSVRTDLYTKGSFNAQSLWRYIKRYSYTGNMNLRYAYVKRSLGSTRREYWINWKHSPRSLRDSRFSASVNAGSSSYNTLDYQNNDINTRTRFQFQHYVQ